MVGRADARSVSIFCAGSSTAGSGAGDEGLLVLLLGDSGEGDALPQLHVGTARELVRRRSLLRIQPARLDIVEVFAQPFENVLALALGNLPLDFRESEVDDIVVVDFLAGQGVA